MAKLQVIALGGLSFLLEDEVISSFASRKAEALLIYLIISEKDVLNREELASLFWEESSASEALLNLRVVLASLKKVLGDFITITRRNVNFNFDTDFFCDTLALRSGLSKIIGESNQKNLISLKDARKIIDVVDFYRGDFLQGFYIKNAPSFEDWVMYQRDCLKNDVVNALHLAINSFIENQLFSEAVQHTLRLLILDPFSELSYRKLMRSYALSGQIDSALESYGKCKKMLSEEIGVEPEGETNNLFEQIKSGKLPRAIENQTIYQLELPIPHNLPKLNNILVGRKNEIESISDHLNNPSSRLITIVGQGGIGKTRLAIEIAYKNLRSFKDGVWFIPCTNVMSSDLLMPNISNALGITIKDNQDVDSQVIEWLDDKQTLLILDNFEDLTEATPLISYVIENSKNIRFLITSREALNIKSEIVVILDGLDFPEIYPSPLSIIEKPQYQTKVAYKEIQKSASVQLFINRIRKSNKKYSPTKQELLEIGYLCLILGGIPLGTELAASGLKEKRPNEIIELIKTNISNLSTDRPDIPERQRNLHAIFEAFWKQLSNEEKSILRRLSVFRGVVTNDSAKAVAGASPFLLSGLVARGLLHRTEPRGYRAHSIHRQFASEELKKNVKEWKKANQDHRDFFFSLLKKNALELRDTPQRRIIDEIETELNNIRAAINYTINDKDEAKALDFCEMLMPFWKIRGYFEEGYYWLDKTLSLKTNASPIMRANALCAVALLVSDLGNYQVAAELGEESLTSSKKIGNQHGVARALNSLGAASSAIGEHEKAKQYYEESLEIYRGLRVQQAIAGTLNKLAAIEMVQKNYVRALEYLNESLKTFQMVGDGVGISRVLNSISRVHLEEGKAETGLKELKSALAIAWDLNHWTGIAYAMENYAKYLILENNLTKAVQIFSVVEEIHNKISYTLPPHEKKLYDQIIMNLESKLGKPKFDKFWDLGKTIVLEGLIKTLV